MTIRILMLGFTMLVSSQYVNTLLGDLPESANTTSTSNMTEEAENSTLSGGDEDQAVDVRHFSRQEGK